MLVFQKKIYRTDLQNNPDVYYVYGDNAAREGYGGQAKAMRGEPNAIGVATKWKPYTPFTDTPEDVLAARTVVECDFYQVEYRLRHGYIVVFPSDGIGTGLADLKNNSPEILELIRDKVRELRRKYNGDGSSTG